VYLNLLAFSEAAQYLEQAREVAQAGNSVFFVRVSTADLALTYIAQNELGRAEALLRAVLDDQPARTRHLRVCWNARAELALAQGDPTYALRIADELIAATPNIDRYGPRGIPRLSQLRGEALAALGRTNEAQAALLAAREGAREQGRRPLLWRIHVSLGKLYRALEQGTEAEQEFAAARALIHELALPLMDESLRAHFLQRALVMIPSPPPLSPRQAVKQEFGGLTAREREVAVFIAQGKSNSEIAGTLVTSKRTVEKHVGSILSKLGFTSRAQIVAWAIEKGLTRPSE
jgi:DNA-binding CsgD family transcriptional regulator